MRCLRASVSRGWTIWSSRSSSVASLAVMSANSGDCTRTRKQAESGGSLSHPCHQRSGLVCNAMPLLTPALVSEGPPAYLQASALDLGPCPSNEQRFTVTQWPRLRPIRQPQATGNSWPKKLTSPTTAKQRRMEDRVSAILGRSPLAKMSSTVEFRWARPDAYCTQEKEENDAHEILRTRLKKGSPMQASWLCLPGSHGKFAVMPRRQGLLMVALRHTWSVSLAASRFCLAVSISARAATDCAELVSACSHQRAGKAEPLASDSSEMKPQHMRDSQSQARIRAAALMSATGQVPEPDYLVPPAQVAAGGQRLFLSRRLHRPSLCLFPSLPEECAGEPHCCSPPAQR